MLRDPNVNPWTEAKVSSENPDRGPLLIITGGKDYTDSGWREVADTALGFVPRFGKP